MAVVDAASSLDVRPTAVKLSGGLGSNASLACQASTKPVLCLWKTPYGHIYTLSEGVSAESGRLRHSGDSSASDRGCGLDILGLEPQDSGQWECEVGAVVGENFQTQSAVINLQIKSKSYHFISSLQSFPIPNFPVPIPSLRLLMT